MENQLKIFISGTEGLLETGIKNVEIINELTAELENIIKLTPVEMFHHLQNIW